MTTALTQRHAGRQVLLTLALAIGIGLFALAWLPQPQWYGALLGILLPWTLASALETRVNIASIARIRAATTATPAIAMEQADTAPPAAQPRPTTRTQAPGSQPNWQPAYGSSPPCS